MMLLSTLTGNGIRRLRTAAGLKRSWLAARMGICESVVRRWEQGEYRPSPRRAKRLAGVLELPLSQFEVEADEEGRVPPWVIVEARYRLGLSTRELGPLLTISDSTVRAWEAGERTLWAGTLEHRALAVRVKQLTAPPPTPETVPEQLRDLRRGYGWSQRELAEQLGVHRSMIGKWERAAQEVPPYRLKQLVGLGL